MKLKEEEEMHSNVLEEPKNIKSVNYSITYRGFRIKRTSNDSYIYYEPSQNTTVTI